MCVLDTELDINEVDIQNQHCFVIVSSMEFLLRYLQSQVQKYNTCYLTYNYYTFFSFTNPYNRRYKKRK